jgi:hypothetical protein
MLDFTSHAFVALATSIRLHKSRNSDAIRKAETARNNQRESIKFLIQGGKKSMFPTPFRHNPIRLSHRQEYQTRILQFSDI